MRKLLWAILFFGAYVWIVTSGHEGIVLDKGKEIYNAFISWFDGADLDFHFKKDKSYKRYRRWD